MIRNYIFGLVALWGYVYGAPPQLQRSVSAISAADIDSSAARNFFLEGLAQLHSFEYETASADFRRAQSIDHRFCLAYWGEAMAYNEPLWGPQDQPAAQAVLKNLGVTEPERLAKCVTERERDYIRAVDILYFSNGTKHERDFKYLDAMADLYKKYPDDVDAGAFYALAILGTAHHGRDVTIYMRALAVLEPLFFAHPENPGVNHYLIHSVDDPAHAPLGLAAARNYSKIALDAPHAQHMTSHIFMALGMWDDVVQANLTAVQLQDEHNVARGRPLARCGHYSSWLEYGYLQEGRFLDAKQVLANCREAAEITFSSKNPDDVGNIAYYGDMRSRYLLDTEEWNGDVAHWPVPPTTGYQGDIAAAFAFADGFSAVRRGDLKAALKAQADLEAADKDENGRPLVPGASPSADMKRVSILRQELDAMIEVAGGKLDAAVATLRAASERENAMEFEFGPPFIDKPTDELLGEVLLRAGRAKEAEAAFESALTRAPERTQSLVGLSQALKAAGDASGSATVNQKLRTIWHNTDQAHSAIH
jgi:tetratricopeptide (TPR) repeat protein